MKIVSLDSIDRVAVEMEGVKNAFKQVPLPMADELPGYTFRVFTLGPDGNTPYHTHPFEHLNYIISGQGALVDIDGNEKPLKAGDFALVNPEEKHQYKNTSPDAEFVMICAVPKERE